MSETCKLTVGRADDRNLVVLATAQDGVTHVCAMTPERAREVARSLINAAEWMEVKEVATNAGFTISADLLDQLNALYAQVMADTKTLEQIQPAVWAITKKIAKKYKVTTKVAAIVMAHQTM